MSKEELELKSAVAVKDGSLHQTISQPTGFEIKSDTDGRSYVTGYIATKDAYSIRGEEFDEEVMTDEALQDIADQINSANEELKTADVVFPDPSTLEKTTGNIEHQNSPNMEKMLPQMADTRAVPAIELESASYDGYGVEVKAPIREDALPQDTVDAVKKNIKDGMLSAFSIEFRNARDKLERVGNKVKRYIKGVDVAGAGLTQRPKNPTATLTGAEMRSVMAEDKTDYTALKKELKSEIREELKAKHDFSVGDRVEWDTAGGPTDGEVVDVATDSCFNERIDGDVEVCGTEDDPAYLIEMQAADDSEDESTMVAHLESELRMKEEAKAVSDVDLTPPERVVNAAQAALDAKEEFSDQIGDCGTGVGESRAERIVNDNLRPEDFLGGENTAIPDYLDSHEDDLTAEGPPTDWSEDEWTDGCGNVQYALWGYYLDWANETEQMLQDAMEQEDRAKHMDDEEAMRAKMIPMPEDVQMLYPSQGQAEAAALTLGMTESSHSHMLDGEEWYMPGTDHATFVTHMEKMREQLRSQHMEEKAEVAGVEFTGTMEGELDESEIPNDDFEQHYLFPGDTKSESSYPVVDAEGNLRRGNVEAAHSLGARGGVDASELERKLKRLNDEFEDPPIDFKGEEKHISGESMAEQPEDDPDGDSDGEPEQEDKALRDTVEELKSSMEEVKEVNEELREENEELRSELEDHKEMVEMKSDISDLEEELKSLADEHRPVSDPEETRNEKNQKETPKALKAASSEFVKEHRSELAEKYDMTEEEVLEHA